MPIKIGACLSHTNLDRIRAARALGYDYIEVVLNALAAAPEAEAARFTEALREAGLPCLTGNCFFPGDIKLVGPEADASRVSEYVHRLFGRLEPLGCDTLVLGSGGSRRIPDGTRPERAYEQFAQIIRDAVAPHAVRFGKRIALEALRASECNMLNTIKQGLSVVEAVNSPNVGLLLDIYHMYDCGDCPGGTDTDFSRVADMAKLRGRVFHTHVSCAVTRLIPQPGDASDVGGLYTGFGNLLAAAGYPVRGSDGRTAPTMSVEAGEKTDWAAESRAAVAMLKGMY